MKYTDLTRETKMAENPYFQDIPYLNQLKQVLDHGIPEMDRTGVGTRSLFGLTAKYDLTEHFPLFTHKKLHFRGIAEELLWMLNGHTNAKVLEDRGITIWREWGDQETRELGPVYGDGFRSFLTPPYTPCDHESLCDQYCDLEKRIAKDQLQTLLAGLLDNPRSRRHLLTLWNPHTVDQCALPPCHGIAIHFKRQVDLHGIERLHCCMYQRSCDMLLGVPYNVASYSLLTCIIAAWLGIKPGTFTHMLGDAHIYNNHLTQVREIFYRELIVSPRLEVRWPSIVSFKDDITPDKLEEIKQHVLQNHPVPGKIVVFPDGTVGNTSPTTVQGFLEHLTTWPNEAGRCWGLWMPSETGNKAPSTLNLLDYHPHPAIKAPVAV